MQYILRTHIFLQICNIYKHTDESRTVVFFIFGDSPASKILCPEVWEKLSHLRRRCKQKDTTYEDGTVFRNVGT